MDCADQFGCLSIYRSLNLSRKATGLMPRSTRRGIGLSLLRVHGFGTCSPIRKLLCACMVLTGARRREVEARKTRRLMRLLQGISLRVSMEFFSLVVDSVSLIFPIKFNMRNVCHQPSYASHLNQLHRSTYIYCNQPRNDDRPNYHRIEAREGRSRDVFR